MRELLEHHGFVNEQQVKFAQGFLTATSCELLDMEIIFAHASGPAYPGMRMPLLSRFFVLLQLMICTAAQDPFRWRPSLSHQASRRALKLQCQRRRQGAVLTAHRTVFTVLRQCAWRSGSAGPTAVACQVTARA